MSRKRRRPQQRKPQPRTHQPAKQPWWRRPLVWIGSLAGALVIAIVTALGTGVGQTLLSVASSNGASGTAAGTKSDPSPTGPPVVVESAMYLLEPDFGLLYAFPRPVTMQQVHAVGLNALYYESYVDQFTRFGGVFVGSIQLQIVLRGNAVNPVEIVGIQAIKNCAPPLAGTLVFIPPTAPMAGVLPIIQDVGFNLDAPFPVAQDITRNGNLAGNFFSKDTISLKNGETQPIDFSIDTQQYCQFTFQMTIDTAHGQVAETISNHEKPFTLTAQASLAAYKALYTNDQRVSVAAMRSDLGS